MTNNAEIGQTLQKLLEGNKRFSSSRQSHLNQSGSAVTSLRKAKNPLPSSWAVPDSRVPPEIIFDEGLGDLLASVSQVISSMTWRWAALNTPWTISVPSLLSFSVIQSAVPSPPLCGMYCSRPYRKHCRAIKPAVDTAKTSRMISLTIPLKQTPGSLPTRYNLPIPFSLK